MIVGYMKKKHYFQYFWKLRKKKNFQKTGELNLQFSKWTNNNGYKLKEGDIDAIAKVLPGFLK